MFKMSTIGSFHYAGELGNLGIYPTGDPGILQLPQIDQFSYTFENFFHPFVGDMITQLNLGSIEALLDPSFQAKSEAFFTSNYTPIASKAVNLTYFDKAFDVASAGPYANYNWEILFHIPVMIAVHLSSNQRFSEAQKWFHYVFDPTSTDTSTAPPQRFWKFIAFRQEGTIESIDSLLTLLSTPDDQLSATQLTYKQSVQTGYNAMLTNPFQPHVIARTRISAYQYYVVMKYLDNLIAWGDNLFTQDTIETLNEATLCYVLAANILGPRPQALPERGTVAPQCYATLKASKLDAMSNAMVALEGQFPFNLTPGPGTGSGGGSGDLTGPLFGIGRTLNFCVPPNQTLLGYWDIVADRLFKIRNSENIEGVVQQLPLFDPPIDPGMLVKAAAAGLDIGSIVSGLNQPLGPMRSLFLIQKALEIAAEVRSLGNTLLSAIEKGDAEQLALLRQGHEITLQTLTQNVRFLQWKQAEEATNALLKTRDSAIERYTYYLSLLGLTPDSKAVPTFTPDRRELTEDNFDQTYSALVTEYDLTVAAQPYPKLQLAGSNSPSSQSGATGIGQLYLNTQEDSELNTHLPASRDKRLAANTANAIAAGVTPIPSAEAHLAFWGIGIHSVLFSGEILGFIAKIAAEVLQTEAAYESDQAGIASRTASYQRRVGDWVLQANLAARELMAIGRQIVGLLIAEQVARHEYDVVKTQVQQAQAVQSFLQNKFTSADFYTWMQSQAAGLYYQYYRLAFDTARQAEQTMKQELMRPELDATTFVQFNYWDTGHQGLLSGEALYLDVKRMELAYHDNNKRELEMTRHVSLRQLDPLALLTLKVTGTCTVSVPEWLYDRDCPGHYMRRVKSIGLSVPAVAGPYTGVNCTVTLQSSSVRTSPLLKNNVYARDTKNADDRFVDYFGSVDTIVTSSGTSDSGMFETNLKDERFLPFEGAGAVSTWTLALPPKIRAFDYMTISDVILHIRYTAREAGDPLGSQSTKELQAMLATAGQAPQYLMFCLRYDFPTEWAAFVNSSGNFSAALQKSFFPYAAQSAKLTVTGLTLYAPNAAGTAVSSLTPAVDLTALSAGLNSAGGTATISLPSDANVLVRSQTQQAFLLLQYCFK
jgi:hypothetical protein